MGIFDTADKRTLRFGMAGLLASGLAMGVPGLSTAQEAAETPKWAETRWGSEDELGAANHMTPERTKLAAELVTEGKVYSLGIVVGPDTPAFPPRSLSLTILQPGQNGNSGLGKNAFTYNDDIFMGWLGIGPQIDGLGHAGEDHVYYGGRRYEDFAPASGLTELGLDKLPGLVGRGVLLDMARHFDTEMVSHGCFVHRPAICDHGQIINLCNMDLQNEKRSVLHRVFISGDICDVNIRPSCGRK